MCKSFAEPVAIIAVAFSELSPAYVPKISGTPQNDDLRGLREPSQLFDGLILSHRIECLMHERSRDKKLGGDSIAVGFHASIGEAEPDVIHTRLPE